MQPADLLVKFSRTPDPKTLDAAPYDRAGEQFETFDTVVDESLLDETRALWRGITQARAAIRSGGQPIIDWDAMRRAGFAIVDACRPYGT